MTDNAFDFLSPPAIAARESTRRVLSWSAQDKDNLSKFVGSVSSSFARLGAIHPSSYILIAYFIAQVVDSRPPKAMHDEINNY